MAKVFAAQAIEKLETSIGSKKLGEMFLELGYLNRAKLEHALQLQQEKGGRLGWILATYGYISRLELYEGLARHLSLPFEKNLGDVRRRLNRKLAESLTHEEIVRFQAIPFQSDDLHITILTAEPDEPAMLAFVQQKFPDKFISQSVMTDLDITRLSSELYRSRIVDESVHGLLDRSPEESAYHVFSKEQIAFGAGFLAMLGVMLYLDAAPTLLAVLLAVQILFAAPLISRLVLVILGRFSKRAFPVSLSGKNLHDAYLPVYTIMVPAYKEKPVIGNLIKCLKKMDYPEDKLDIILLLEENDTETLEAAKAEKPPANWRFLVCPDNQPRTKPKALNYGLNFARGEFLTIYDAEDLPAPDQLKKAVAAFRAHPDDYICFRASVNYFNKKENALTRLFALENALWADGAYPGMFRLGLPLPLGGSSNHFDMRKLRALGAWDPFNMTEDADLGVRAAAAGYKVGVIASSTDEEAPSGINNWLRQRSRLVKGYLQTFLVQSRRPVQLIKSMGLVKWLSYSMLIGGTPVIYLLNPLMWALLITSILLDVYGVFHVPNALIYLAALNLIIGNAIVMLTYTIGAATRKNRGLLPLVLLTPFYWLMESAAAFKGLWQLFTRPFYWEKTEHGVTKDVPAYRTLDIPENLPEMVVVREGHKK